MKTVSCLVLVALLLVGATAQAGDALVWEPKDNRVVGAFNAAVGLLNDGQLAQAEPKFRRVLKLQPDFGPAWITLGQTLFRLDRPVEAITVYERVLADAPDHSEVLAPLAWALFGAQRFEDAQAMGVRAVEALPEDESGWQGLVLAELRLGTYERIGVRLAEARAVKESPSLACYATQVLVELGRVDEAETAMMVCRDAEDERLLSNSEGAIAEARGDVVALGEFAEELGDDGATAHHRAIVAFNRGRYEEAEALAGRALKLGFPTPEAQLVRAQARYELGKSVAARRDLQAVLGDDGTWVKVTRKGGLTGVLTKKHERSLRVWMQGGAVVLVLLHAQADELDKADQALVDARSAFGDYPALQAAEAMVFWGRGEEGKAWSLAAKALEGKPDPRVLRIVSMVVGKGVVTITDDAVVAIAKHGSAVLVYNLAVGSSNGGEQARCVELVQVLTSEPGEDPPRSQRWAEARAGLLPDALSLGYDCAVRAPDLEAAERFGEQAGWTAVPRWAAVSHGNLLYEAKQLDAFFAHFERCKPTDGLHSDWALSLLVRASLDLKDLDQALKWARYDSAGPITRYNVGTALAVDGREADAKGLLEAACPELEGDTAEACRTNLEIVNENLAR